jgi:hypothetical protein
MRVRYNQSFKQQAVEKALSRPESTTLAEIRHHAQRLYRRLTARLFGNLLGDSFVSVLYIPPRRYNAPTKPPSTVSTVAFVYRDASEAR